MPNVQVNQYLVQKIGIDTNQLNPNKDMRALIFAAIVLHKNLSRTLYYAVVQQHQDTALTGPALSALQIHDLYKVALRAKNNRSCPRNIRNVINDFACAARHYSDFLALGDERAMNVSSVINKQGRQAAERQTHATPRHTLWRRGSEIYEVLTWMTQKEIARINSRFPATNGLFSLNAERSRSNQWGDQKVVEHKVTLGSGAYGVARIARQVSSDQYMVLKKEHPKGEGPKPLPTPIIQNINDGSQTGISQVYDSFMAYSTRGGGKAHVEPSVYTLSEMGVIDTHKFISIFSIMTYALNEENWSEELAKSFFDEMVSGATDLETEQNRVRIKANPCSDPRLVRRFRNTFAQQMLQAVEQMHAQDRAHNDLKPDNFILAYDSEKLLHVKLIDLDSSSSIKESVGRPRKIYTKLFAAPQVSSNQADNRADLNDAYSMGCTLRMLNGEPIRMLALQRRIVRGEINAVDPNNQKVNLAENRRAIEGRFSKLPEMTCLADVIDLLCQPESGERYTISQALKSPLFSQQRNLLTRPQFTNMAEKIIRHGHLLSKGTIDQLEVMQHCEYLATRQSTQRTGLPFGPMVLTLRQQDRKLLFDRYTQTHGEERLNAKLREIKEEINTENALAR